MNTMDVHLSARLTVTCRYHHYQSVQQALDLLPVFGKAFLTTITPNRGERTALGALSKLELAEVLCTPSIDTLSITQQIIRRCYPGYNIDQTGIAVEATDSGMAIQCAHTFAGLHHSGSECLNERLTLLKQAHPNYIIFLNAVLATLPTTLPVLDLDLTPIVGR